MMLKLVTFSLCLGLGAAVTGVDVSSSVSTSEWECLEDPGGQVRCCFLCSDGGDRV
jgi:hypothetical protein